MLVASLLFFVSIYPGPNTINVNALKLWNFYSKMKYEIIKVFVIWGRTPVAEECCRPECLCLVVWYKFVDVSEERATCIFYPEDGGVTLRENIGEFLWNYTVSYDFQLHELVFT